MNTPRSAGKSLNKKSERSLNRGFENQLSERKLINHRNSESLIDEVNQALTDLKIKEADCNEDVDEHANMVNGNQV